MSTFGGDTMIRDDKPYREFDEGRIRVFGYSYDQAGRSGVVRAHEETGTVRVIHRLLPIAVVMAGADVVDPVKD